MGWGVGQLMSPSLHSESFKTLGRDLRVILMAYCQSGVSNKRCFNGLSGGTRRISRNWSAGNFADCKILNS
jgi:hypothetical protein